MKRICIFGNSHVSAISQGVEALKAKGLLEKVDITMFASSSDSIRNCEVKNGVVSTPDKSVQRSFERSSGGLSEIKIEDYDEFFIHMGVPLSSLHQLWIGEPESPYFDLPQHSEGLISEIVNDMMTKRWHMKLAHEISMKRPTTFVGAPYKSEADPRSKAILEKIKGSDTDIAQRIIHTRQMIDQCLQSVNGGQLTFKYPPSNLLEKYRLFTKHEYCRGSRRALSSNTEHQEDDFSHMNAAYGEALVRNFMVRESATVNV
ncbi:hypothetical protein ACFE33_04945 [Falsihalocynthiibacter sp. SS001]|uniref:hypothetical protein n=1 Tax=Falsihalocynthiibacter sp. SS001 TaxID=3349698 RepID=UPI0036D2C51E